MLVLTQFHSKQTPNVDLTEVDEDDIRCVSWDFAANDNGGDWSEAGCRLMRASHGKAVCSCDRLTTFAILIVCQL